MEKHIFRIPIKYLEKIGSDFFDRIVKESEGIIEKKDENFVWVSSEIIESAFIIGFSIGVWNSRIKK